MNAWLKGWQGSVQQAMPDKKAQNGIGREKSAFAPDFLAAVCISHGISATRNTPHGRVFEKFQYDVDFLGEHSIKIDTFLKRCQVMVSLKTNINLRMKSALLSLCLMLVLSANVIAQEKQREEYLLEQARLKRMMLNRELDSGVYFMNEGKYELADSKFKYVLANIKGVPSDLAYHFGKNSYMLGHYAQSVDWLNKYIQLKGMNGQYSSEAVSWLRKAEAGVLEARAKESAQKEAQLLSSNYEIDCGPTGKVICPVCRGDHVIIKRGAFGDQYQTCPYCNEHGILTCEEYNLLIRGSLKPKF